MAGCMALVRSASWNQNEADWRRMLEAGRGWGISLADGTLAASTLVLPYGDFAWISMVLVLPQQRGKGYASRLLRTAIAYLEDRDLTPILDATPAGRAVYLQEGFSDRWGFKRYVANAEAVDFDDVAAVRPIRDSDWPRILELDEQAFGASREALLRSFYARRPQAAWLIEGRGHVFGREGREAQQIGPLVARDTPAAAALLAVALRNTKGRAYLDVADHSPLRSLVERSGFSAQRPFTRMVRGATPAPGDRGLVHLVAGPELG
jgi:GNAT superfamily N-acetyltransferase